MCRKKAGRRQEACWKCTGSVQDSCWCLVCPVQGTRGDSPVTLLSVCRRQLVARVTVPVCSERLAGTRMCVRDTVGGSSGEQNEKGEQTMFLEIPVSLPRYLCSPRCHQGAAAGAARVPGSAEGRLQHPCEMRHTELCQQK